MTSAAVVLAQGEAALAGERTAIAKLTSLFERDDAQALALMADAVAHLRSRRPEAAARIVALTGAPGVGKSSLVAAMLAARAGTAEAALRVAILAIDPASQRSGGALLGDRARAMTASAAAGVFFRSQSSQGVLGGIAEATPSVVRLWSYLFDAIIIETVGVGQNEADVTELAAQTWLVLQPGAGDHLQYLKAGIMERVQRFVINKGDLPGAAQTAAQLRAAMMTSAASAADAPDLVSSRTGHGVAALWPRLGAVAATSAFALEAVVLARRCQRELGRGAEALLQRHGGAAAWTSRAGGAEAAWIAHLASRSG